MENANENIYVIYKHVNKINGKTYVGQTSLKPQDRWNNGKGYESYTILPNGEKKPAHFWASICKYGWNNFEHKVLIHGLTKSQADFWEKKLIKEWDLMNPQKGYNKKEGGSNGKLSDEIIDKRTRTVVSKGIFSGENHPFYGKHHTEETLKKISKTQKEKFANGEFIPWNKGKTNVYSEKTLKKMSKTKKEKYASGELVAWNKGKKCPQFSGENHPVYGKHHSEETKQKLSERKKIKVVRLYDNNIYQSIEECARDNHKSKLLIIRHCKNKLKTKPQEFMYYDKFLDIKDKMC